MAEFVTLVDENDVVIGSKDRDLLTDSDRWRIIVVWITDANGQILIAQRSHLKKIEPNLWGPAVAGTVEDPNDYMETARRELAEELGIQDTELTVETTEAFDAAFGKRVCAFVRAKVDIALEDISVQEEEVSAIRWVNEEELRQEVSKNPESFVKNFPQFMEHFLHD